MKALDELITTKIPKLHAHFRAVELDISIIATDWYLCLFCTSLPSETVGGRRRGGVAGIIQCSGLTVRGSGLGRILVGEPHMECTHSDLWL